MRSPLNHCLTTGPISEPWTDNFFDSMFGHILKILLFPSKSHNSPYIMQ